MLGAQPGPTQKHWWRWWPRVSLLTLLLFVLLLSSLIGLWHRWAPWTLDRTLNAPPQCYGRFLPGGSKLLVRSGEGPPCIWDIGTNSSSAFLDRYVRDVNEFTSTQDTVIGTGRLTIQVWSMVDGAKRMEIRVPALSRDSDENMEPFEAISETFLSQDNRTVLVRFDSGCAGLWDLTTGKCLGWLADREPLKHLTVSPAGHGRRYCAGETSDGRIIVWEVGRCSTPLSFMGPLIERCQKLTMAPDGAQILIAAEDRNLRIWNWRSGSTVELRGRGYVRMCGGGFSPDSQRVALAGDGFVFRMWDVNTGELLAAEECETGRLCTAFFLPDGSRLLTADFGKPDQKRLWDATSGAPVGELLFPDKWLGYCRHALLSPGRLLLSFEYEFPFVDRSGGDLMVYDTKYGSLMTVVGGRDFQGRLLDRSADGERLLLQTPEGKAHVWVRQRSESHHGYMDLPEFWLVATLTPLLLWSLCRDARMWGWMQLYGKAVAPIPSWKRRLLARQSKYARVQRG